MIIDPAQFLWHDTDWKGVKIEGQVIYEMHIGTFTAEGTWKAARQQLTALKDLGVTVLEIMPVHDFYGRFGWGYDGVDFFAPTRLYGSPDDFRAFVDTAHGLGLGVILDVVYNHAGPDGKLSERFFAGLFYRPLFHRLGRSVQFRRAQFRAGAGIFHCQRGLLD